MFLKLLAPLLLIVVVQVDFALSDKKKLLWWPNLECRPSYQDKMFKAHGQRSEGGKHFYRRAKHNCGDDDEVDACYKFCLMRAMEMFIYQGNKISFIGSSKFFLDVYDDTEMVNKLSAKVDEECGALVPKEPGWKCEGNDALFDCIGDYLDCKKNP